MKMKSFYVKANEETANGVKNYRGQGQRVEMLETMFNVWMSGKAYNTNVVSTHVDVDPGHEHLGSSLVVFYREN